MGAPKDPSFFLEFLDSPAGRARLEELTQDFIRQIREEEAFWDQIQPPLTGGTDHDTLVKIEDVEPDSRVVRLNFRGR